MRAAVYHSNADVRVADVPEPSLGPGELLVEVDACGVCGSDVMEWYRKPKAPLVLGHEIVGRVVGVGAGAPYRNGERVFATHHVPCMTCASCLKGRHTVCDTLRTTSFEPGGFAERLRVPAINVRHGTFRVPDSIPDDEAVFIEPLACAVRGQRRAGVVAGRSMLVLGCGTAGLLHILLAHATGVTPIVATDVNPERLDAARRCGADAAVLATGDIAGELKRATGGALADVVIVSTGAPAAIKTAQQLVEPGGSILWFAPSAPETRLDADFNKLWRNEITMTSSYAAAPADLAESLALLAGGRVRARDLVTHRFPLARSGEAFRMVAEAKEGLKVLIRPND